MPDIPDLTQIKAYLLQKLGELQASSISLDFWIQLTVILSVVGIGVSFPIGLMLALGRRSEVRGVPYLWLYGVGLLFTGMQRGPTACETRRAPAGRWRSRDGRRESS